MLTTSQARSGIYAITNSVNGKVYVGSAVNMSRRWIKHRHELKAGTHHCEKLVRAWAKYGAEKMVFSVLIRCEPKDLLFYEQRAIDAYDSVRSGYNVNPVAGSRLGAKSTKEHCANISKALKGKVRTEEQRKRIGDAQRGVKRGRYTPEHCAAISTAKKGKPRSPETKAKLSAANMGKPCLESTKKILSMTHKGKKKLPESIAKRTATRAANRAALTKQ